MKPSAFDYVAPRSLDEALAELAKDPEESKVLSGGQSLVPMMNFRLANPARLVDINQVPGLEGIEISGDDRMEIKARTRHVSVEHMAHEGPLAALLRAAASHVGHLPIRSRGTFGGSVAHCDAASEWCLIAALLDAEMTAVSQARGSRDISASDFFQSIFTTALEPDEILTAVSLPLLDDTWATGIAEFARRAGDFAIVSVAGAVRVSDGAIAEARISIGGVDEVPFRSRVAEGVMIGEPFSDELLHAAADAAAQEVNPPSDTHGDATFRRDLVRALLPRAFSGVEPGGIAP